MYASLTLAPVFFSHVFIYFVIYLSTPFFFLLKEKKLQSDKEKIIKVYQEPFWVH